MHNIYIIGIYRSQGGNDRDLIGELEAIVDKGKTTVLGGDLNLCIFAQPYNWVTRSLKEMGFEQIVTEATHIDGGVLDHVYILQGGSIRFQWILEYFPKYYSDHDGLGLTLWEA